MRITKGRGNKRQVVDLPHGSAFAQAASSKDPEHQSEYRRAHYAICETLGVDHSGRL